MTQKLGPNQLALVEALEGGEYKQGVEYLCGDGSFCCLGVAANLRGKTSRAMGGKADLHDFPDVVEAYGFHWEDGYFPSRPAEEPVAEFPDLATANDEGCTFKQIAAFMREYPECVFKEAL